MVSVCCPETLVRNNHSMLHKIPKERRSHLYLRVNWKVEERGSVAISCSQSYTIGIFPADSRLDNFSVMNQSQNMISMGIP